MSSFTRSKKNHQKNEKITLPGSWVRFSPSKGPDNQEPLQSMGRKKWIFSRWELWEKTDENMKMFPLGHEMILVNYWCINYWRSFLWFWHATTSFITNIIKIIYHAFYAFFINTNKKMHYGRVCSAVRMSVLDNHWTVLNQIWKDRGFQWPWDLAI